MKTLEIVNSLPFPVRRALAEHPGKLVLAGGYIRAFLNNEPINDIDLFISGDKEKARAIAYKIAESTLTAGIVETDNAFTIQTPVAVQVIYRWTFAVAIEVIDGFDFTVSQACIWWDNGWQGYTSPEFHDHVEMKMLRYTDPLGNNMGGTFSRLLKFSRLGYTTDRETLAELMAAMCQGMRPETLLGTQSTLQEAFLEQLPKHGISGRGPLGAAC